MLDIEGFVSRNFENYIIADDDLQVDCPFCERRTGKYDNKHHLGINMYKPLVHCFRCDYSSDWIRFVMDLTGQSYAISLGELYVKPRMVDFERSMDKLRHGADKQLGDVELPDDFHLLNRKDPSMLMQLSIGYLKRRGFAYKQCLHYKLGVADSIPARVIIPVEDDYWQGRSIMPCVKPKYVNPKSKSRQYIFNYPALGMYDEIVICEGAFSAMAVGHNAIALISKTPTQERMERISSSKASHFIIALEPEAYKSMMPLADKLYRCGKDVIIWKFSHGDPADPDYAFEEYHYNLRNRVYMRLEERHVHNNS